MRVPVQLGFQIMEFSEFDTAFSVMVECNRLHKEGCDSTRSDVRASLTHICFGNIAVEGSCVTQGTLKVTKSKNIQ
jgi:hypothetical protein